MHTAPLASNGGNIVSQLAAMDGRSWYQKPNLRALYIVLLPACVAATMTSAFDTNLMDVLQATSSWKTCAGRLGLMTAMYSLGGIFSLPIVPVIVDGRGRRAAMIIGGIIMFVGGILQGASQNLPMFVAARFILGFGTHFAILGSASLIGELAHPKERVVITSLFSGFLSIGSVIVAAISLGTNSMQSNWGWRIPSLLQATPSLLQLTLVIFVPESPRWLLSQGRNTEAFEILVKYHAEGDAQSELVKAEYADIQNTLGDERGALSWRQLFATRGMRRRAILSAFLGIAGAWSGSGLIGNYLPRILGSVGIHDNMTKNRVNLAHASWGLLCATTVALQAPKFKRRTMFLTCAISLLLVMVGLTVATAEWTNLHTRGSATAVLALIFLFSPAFSMGFSLVYTYLLELFPFPARAKGMVLHSWFGGTVGFFNQIVNPIGMQNAGWKYYISYCLFLAFQVVFVYFMFPETAGRTLEELAFLYEDDDKKPDASRGEKIQFSTFQSEVSSLRKV
ncbi:hexose transporter [Mycena galericulata]|nr:hexose transporter [Mycena galericulata]